MLRNTISLYICMYIYIYIYTYTYIEYSPLSSRSPKSLKPLMKGLRGRGRRPVTPSTLYLFDPLIGSRKTSTCMLVKA